MEFMRTLAKKVSLALLLLALGVMWSVGGSVASAQEATATVGTTVSTPVATADNDDDGFPWGLLGLLGLAGLAGLRPKEHSHTVERTTDRTPNR